MNHIGIITRLICIMIAAMLAGCENESSQSLPKTAIPESKIVDSLAAAEQYLATNDLIKAQAILERLIDRAPDDSRAYELYGQVLAMLAIDAEERGNTELTNMHRKKAYSMYRDAVRLDPNSAGLQHSAGIMASSTGELQAALEHFQVAGKLDDTNHQYPLFEAQLLIQLKRSDEAEIALNRVLAIDPDEPFAYASLAMIALERNDFDEAIERIREARAIEPNRIEFRAQHARIYRESGKVDIAIELLLALRSEERAMDIVAYELAECYVAKGNYLNAARVWEHVFETNPPHLRAAIRVSDFLLTANQIDMARSWLSRAQEIAPDSSEVRQLENRFRN